MIHQLAGDGIAAWLDEGLATRVSAIDAAIIDRPRADAIAMIQADRRSLSIFTDHRDGQTVDTAYGGRAYGVAAEAVLEIERRIGRSGLTALLDAIGRGASIEDGFQTLSGETLDDFIARLPAALCGPRPDGGVAPAGC